LPTIEDIFNYVILLKQQLTTKEQINQQLQQTISNLQKELEVKKGKK